MLLLASPAAIQVPILLQTDRYAVVAKPPGMVVHRNKFVSRDSVPLLQVVRDQLGRYVNAVHRLDGGTSGCVVFAYDSETTAMLQAAMTSGAASKTYYAFVRGDASRLRDHLEERELKDDKGVVKEARTWLDCVAACEDSEEHGFADGDPGSSLIVAKPHTGRWHQIRKHMNGHSHPILGDAKHGNSKLNRWWREKYGLQGLGLHCAALEIPLPDGTVLRARAPVRRDLVSIWEQMPWWEQACAALPELRGDAALAREAAAAEEAAAQATAPATLE